MGGDFVVVWQLRLQHGDALTNLFSSFLPSPARNLSAPWRHGGVVVYGGGAVRGDLSSHVAGQCLSFTLPLAARGCTTLVVFVIPLQCPPICLVVLEQTDKRTPKST